jgi:hypothetical protein
MPSRTCPMLSTQGNRYPHAVRFEVAQGHYIRHSTEFVSPCYFHRTLDGTKKTGLALLQKGWAW